MGHVWGLCPYLCDGCLIPGVCFGILQVNKVAGRLGHPHGNSNENKEIINLGVESVCVRRCRAVG